MIHFVELAASTFNKLSGILKLQAFGLGLPGKFEQFGEVPAMFSLGVMSRPWPMDEKGGAAEGLVWDNGGMRWVFGARDTRVGVHWDEETEPGDSVFHAVGPGSNARLYLRHAKREVELRVLPKKGKHPATLKLNGETNEAKLEMAGHTVRVSEKGGIELNPKGGKAGIVIKDGEVRIIGDLVLGKGPRNRRQRFMLGPLTGSIGGGSASPMKPARSIYVT